MDPYREWLEAECRTHPRLDVAYDAALGAYVELLPEMTRFISLVRVIGRGTIVMDSYLCRKRFPRLFEPTHREYDGGKPISPIFIEPSIVFAPYYPEGV